MGLDMYLTKRVYVGAEYEHRKVTGKIDIKVGKEKLPVNFKKVSEIIEQAGYWRKANAIHKWFVDNVQDGEDNCGDYYVDEEKLQSLLDICNTLISKLILEDGKVLNGTKWHNGEEEEIYEEGKVITNPELAEELLPCQSGFFFGSTQYDEYYYQDLVHTKKILEDALANPGYYYYHSSW